MTTREAESFFSRFKAKLVENGVFESVADAGQRYLDIPKAITIGSDCIRV